MTVMTDSQFAAVVAENSFKRLSKRDCENLANSQLISAMNREGLTADSMANILDEMRRRAAKDAYCAERFADFI